MAPLLSAQLTPPPHWVKIRHRLWLASWVACPAWWIRCPTIIR